jgi:hypothetical protein
VEESVRAGFVQSIAAGKAAGMLRAAIDRIYRKAWEQVPETMDEFAGKRGQP